MFFFNNLCSPTCSAPVSCESICKSNFVFPKSRLRSGVGNPICDHWKRRSLKHFRGVQFRWWGKTWSPVKSITSCPPELLHLHLLAHGLVRGEQCYFWEWIVFHFQEKKEKEMPLLHVVQSTVLSNMEEDHHLVGYQYSSKATQFFVVLTPTLIFIGALSAVCFWAGWQVKSKETCPLTRVECGSLQMAQSFLLTSLWNLLDFFLYLWNWFFKAVIS